MNAKENTAICKLSHLESKHGTLRVSSGTKENPHEFEFECMDRISVWRVVSKQKGDYELAKVKERRV